MIHVECTDRIIEFIPHETKKRDHRTYRPDNEDATNCLVSVCSRLARFGRLGRTWDKTRVFGSGSIDKPSGSTLSGLTLRHLNSSVLTAIRDNRHLWKGAGVAEGRHRKERSAAPPDADRHRISCTAYCYPAIYSNGGAKQRKTSMITRFPLARDKFLLLNAMLVALNWWINLPNSPFFSKFLTRGELKM